jgi:hypothetical protein
MIFFKWFLKISMLSYSVCKKCSIKGVYIPHFDCSLDELDETEELDNYINNDYFNDNQKITVILKCDDCSNFYCKNCLNDWSCMYNCPYSDDSDDSEGDKLILFYCNDCVYKMLQNNIKR